MPAGGRRQRKPADADPRSGGATREDLVYADLRRRIRDGELAGGAALPSLRDLATRHRTSVFTAHRALRRLAAEGAVVIAHGSGARVASPEVAASAALARPLVSVVGEMPPPPLRSAPQALGSMLPHWILHHVAADPRLRVGVGATAPGVASGLASRVAEARALGAKAIVLLDETFAPDARAAIEAARRDGIRPIHVATHEELPGADRVDSDFAGGQRALTLALAAAGRRSPLRLALRETPRWELGRAEGYARALRELGLGAPGPRTVRVDGELVDPGDRVARLAAALRPALERTRADAVLALSDADAIFTRAALARLGRADVLVAGYDASWRELLGIGLLDGWAASLGDEAAAARLDAPPPSVDRDLGAVAAAVADLAARRALGDATTAPTRVLVPQVLRLEG